MSLRILADLDPLDMAVDRACEALNEVAQIADQRGALRLGQFAVAAIAELLGEWENVE